VCAAIKANPSLGGGAKPMGRLTLYGRWQRGE
jgi:hypothetical protein